MKMNIFNLGQKLHECNRYIEQLETQNRRLQENIRLTAQGEQSKYEAAPHRLCDRLRPDAPPPRHSQ